MGIKEYKEKKQRPKRRRVAPILGAVLVVVLIVTVVAFYDQRSPTKSNTVYCGVFEYLETTARSIIGVSTSNVTLTMTTAISYTTSTSIAGVIGHTHSNGTSTTNANGLAGGVETICKYISNTSSST
jgi:hypothetical protein